MKQTSLLSAFIALSVSAHGNVLGTGRCNADNCARAATGTAGGSGLLSSRIAACSSFLASTIILPVPTTTVTITSAPTSAGVDQAATATQAPVATDAPSSVTTPGLAARDDGACNQGSPASPATVTITVIAAPAANNAQTVAPVTTFVIPTSIPDFAGACLVSSRYSSACSCWGIQQTTVTSVASLVTQTVTVSSSATTTGSVSQTSTTSGQSQTTSPSTKTTTIASTTSTTATFKPTGSHLACGSTVRGAGVCGCSYTVTCGALGTSATTIGQSTEASELDCLNKYDSAVGCDYANYRFSTGECQFQQGKNEPLIGVADSDDDVISFTPGQCSDTGCGLLTASGTHGGPLGVMHGAPPTNPTHAFTQLGSVSHLPAEPAGSPTNKEHPTTQTIPASTFATATTAA